MHSSRVTDIAPKRSPVGQSFSSLGSGTFKISRIFCCILSRDALPVGFRVVVEEDVVEVVAAVEMEMEMEEEEEEEEEEEVVIKHTKKKKRKNHQVLE